MADSMVLFDKKIRVKTVEPKVESVNLVLRFLAFLIDGFFILIILLFVEIFMMAALVQGNHFPTLIHALVTHFVYWGIPAQVVVFVYYSYFYLNYSASPGKMIFNLAVRPAHGAAELTVFQVLAREIVGKFFSVMFFGFGFLLAFIRKDGRALHDLLSSSQVVRDDQRILPG